MPQNQEIIIKHQKGWIHVNFRELWAYRELLYFLTWRDIKVKYKQTALGVVWVILQPFLTMIIFSILFGRLAKVPSPAASPSADTFWALKDI